MPDATEDPWTAAMLTVNALLLAAIASTLVLILLAILFPQAMRVLVGGALFVASLGAFWIWSADITEMPTSWKDAQGKLMPGSNFPSVNPQRVATQQDQIAAYVARDKADEIARCRKVIAAAPERDPMKTLTGDEAALARDESLCRYKVQQAQAGPVDPDPMAEAARIMGVTKQ